MEGLTKAESQKQTAGRWTGGDWLIASSLFAATLLSRVPFRTGILYAWDSVLYAQALNGFDVTVHHPQPPGHIYYVGLVWLIDRITADPNAAMVWISVFAGAGSVAALYLLARMMFRRPVSLISAGLLATSISFWAFSEVAYPYTLLALLGIIAAGFIWRAWSNGAWLVPAAAALGLAAGFRQDLLPFMLPLLALAAWNKGWKRISLAGAVLVITTALWYIPSALLSGGLGVYRAASDEQTDYLIRYFSVFGIGLAGLRSNLHQLYRFFSLGLGAAIPVVVAVTASFPASYMRSIFRDRRFVFLTVWIVPSFLFYAFIHVGEYGYIFTELPALLLLGTWGLYRLARASGPAASNRACWVFRTVALLVIAANAVLFVFAGTPLSAGRISAREEILRSRLDAVRQNFDPRQTFVIVVFDFQQVAYYLPEYSSWCFDPAVETNPSIAVPKGVTEVVVFDEYMHPADPGAADVIDLPMDQTMSAVPSRGKQRIDIDWDTRTVSVE